MGTNVGRWMKLGGDAWVTVDDDGPTAMLYPEDIDAFPPLVEARDTIDRLTVENADLKIAIHGGRVRAAGDALSKAARERDRNAVERALVAAEAAHVDLVAEIQRQHMAGEDGGK